MSGFHEVRFPTEIARGATGGPLRRTEIVTLASGREERNGQWAHSKRSFNAGYGVRTLSQLQSVIDFFEERRGRLHAFRFKDPFDFSSIKGNQTTTPLDQAQSIDADAPTFQLSKNYGTGETGYLRPILKPVAGSVRVAVDGEELLEGNDFLVDATTGLISRLGSNWIASSSITAGFHFDVPVRFDVDQLDLDLGAFEAGSIPDIPLVEVRP